MLLIKKNGSKIIYHDEFYNVVRNGEQWIRLTDGCFRGCWFCYTPKNIKVYDFPIIKANKVRFLDQNFLYAHPTPLNLINSLPKKFNNKVIHYTFSGGLDFTLLTLAIIKALKKSKIGRFNSAGHFINGLSISWDRSILDKTLILKVINMMLESGYRQGGIQVKVLCNGKISYFECMKKLKVLYDYKIMIDDCWFDNQKRRSVKSIYWTKEECISFGKCCRANNVIVMQNLHEGVNKLLRIN